MGDTRHQWRHQYDEDRDAYEQALTDIGDFGPSLTQQHFAKDADLNVIVARFGIFNAAIPVVPVDPQYYGDFTDVPDFRQALEATLDAQTRFDALPAELRNRFQNDPVLLWEFVNNPINTEEAIRIGLLKTEAPVVIPEVPALP